jgi:HemY protein
LSRKGDLRRAAKILEAAWRIQPHPDLAEVYLNLRRGDSGLDRLKRAETLSRMSQGSTEGRLAVARAALESREFGRAREALEPLLGERPSMRVCLLMSDLEQAEHGATGRGREWLARATRAPRDPAWIADGVVSDQWAPISPVTGRLDAFVWQAPPDVLVAPELTMSDDVTADLDDEPRALSVTEEAPTASPPPVEPVGSEAQPPIETPPEPPKPKPQPVVFPAGPPDDPGLREEPTTRRSFFG